MTPVDVEEGGVDVSGDGSCGPSSRTPPRTPEREEALVGGGRRGLPGGIVCLGGLEKSRGVNWVVWVVFMRPEIVMLRPSSVRRGAAVGRVLG